MTNARKVALVIAVTVFVVLIALIVTCGAMCGSEVADILIEGA